MKGDASRTPVAVVLARGLGTRMRADDPDASLDDAQTAVAARGVKAMVPVGRPFIEHILASIAEAGCTRVVIVVGPEHDELRHHLRDVAPPRRLDVAFAIQTEARGTADAIVAAAAVVGDASFLVGNGDNLYPPDAWRAAGAAPGAAVVAFDRDVLLADGSIEPERIARFAILDVHADGTLRDIVEKPDAATFASLDVRRVGMNLWRVTPALVAACRDVPLSPRGEYELPLAVRLALTRGVRVDVIPSGEPVLDLSHRRDIARVAERLRALTPVY